LALAVNLTQIFPQCPHVGVPGYRCDFVVGATGFLQVASGSNA